MIPEKFLELHGDSNFGGGMAWYVRERPAGYKGKGGYLVTLPGEHSYWRDVEDAIRAILRHGYMTVPGEERIVHDPKKAAEVLSRVRGRNPRMKNSGRSFSQGELVVFSPRGRNALKYTDFDLRYRGREGAVKSLDTGSGRRLVQFSDGNQLWIWERDLGRPAVIRRNSAVRLPGTFGVGLPSGGPLREAGNPRQSGENRVIAAFTQRLPATSKKLTTDGTRLDGNWMGGSNIAYWSGDKIHFNDLGGKTAELIQKRIARRVPKNWLATGNPRVEKPGDEAAARELDLFVTSDADLYRQQHQPILKNLVTKMARGTYDREKAVKLFMYLAESGAKKYAQQFGGTWNQLFDVPTRRLAAIGWRDAFEGEAKLGNYDNYLPKKYQKRGRPANQQNPKKSSDQWNPMWWRFTWGKNVAVGHGTKLEARAKASKIAEMVRMKVGMRGPYPTKEAAKA